MDAPKLRFSASSKIASEFKNELKIRLNISTDKQKMIITELLCTEVTYLLQLEILLQFFMVPMKEKDLNCTVFESVFSSVCQLYEVNSELLRLMEENIDNISNTFNVLGPFLKLYSTYACEYKKAVVMIESLAKKNKSLHSFIKRQETRPEVGTSLISLLISPIQRVPRYRLLLQSLLANCSPDQPNYVTTLDALNKIEETANHINNLVTEAEEAETFLQMARRLGSFGDDLVVPGRKIIKQGPLKKEKHVSELPMKNALITLLYINPRRIIVTLTMTYHKVTSNQINVNRLIIAMDRNKVNKNGKRSQQWYLVLMTDAILCCKGSEKGSLSFSRMMPLRNLNVDPIFGSSFFKISCSVDSLFFFTADSKEGSDWIDSLNAAIRQHDTCRKTLRKDNSTHHIRNRGRIATACDSTAAILRKTAHRACKKELKDKPTSLAKLRKYTVREKR